LEGASDSLGCDSVGTEADDILILKLDLSFRGPIKPAYQIKNCSFPRAIRADKSHQLSPLKGKIEIMDCPKTSEKMGHVSDF
jgi:hypothetical protein